MISLNEAADGARPDGRHWIIPGAIREGAKLIVSGSVQSGKTLVALECAVSAFTFTRFMGVLPPWVVAKPVIITDNVYSTVATLQLLLMGRQERDTSGLDMVNTSGHDYSPVSCAARLRAAKKKLIVIDEPHDGKLSDLLHALRPNARDGATIFATTQAPRNTASSATRIQWMREWSDAWLHVRRNSASGNIELIGPTGDCIVNATPVCNGESMVWEPGPPGVGATKLETSVWRQLYRLTQATVSDIAKPLGMADKSRKATVQDDLDSLLKAGSVTFDIQYKGVANRPYRVWSVKLPER